MAKINISLTTALFITFLVLKLTGVIDWSWLWVLSPIWIPIAFAIIVIALMIVGLTILNLFNEEKP